MKKDNQLGNITTLDDICNKLEKITQPTLGKAKKYSPLNRIQTIKIPITAVSNKITIPK